MNHSTPGLPVHHQLPEFTQTHVHRASDAIQPSHLLSSPSPPGKSFSLARCKSPHLTVSWINPVSAANFSTYLANEPGSVTKGHESKELVTTFFKIVKVVIIKSAYSWGRCHIKKFSRLYCTIKWISTKIIVPCVRLIAQQCECT